MSPSPQPPAAVSAQEEEAMSSAYIAQLLAQEEAYGMTADAYDLYGDYDDYRPASTVEDDAWPGSGRKRRPKRADSDWEADDGEEEEDYQPKPGRRRRGGAVGGGIRGRRPVTTPRQPLRTKSFSNDKSDGDSMDTGNTTMNDENHAGAIDENGDVIPSAKKPRRSRPKLEGMNQGAYTPEEEQRFLDGLETFGRGWNEISQYIGTRDSHSIRSHAQKYFIRLFRDNKPLPAKVRESGEGYTLSGLALDPESAAARTYLSRYDATEKTAASEANALGTSRVVSRVTTPLTPLSSSSSNDNTTTLTNNNDNNNNTTISDTTSTMVSDENSTNEEAKSTKSDVIAFGQAPTPLKNKNKPRQPEQDTENTELDSQNTTTLSEKDTEQPRKIPATLPKPLVKKPVKPTPPEFVVPVGADGRTDYSRNRPQRRTKPSVNFSQLAVGADPLTMVKCDEFSGPPGSGIAGAQPFTVTVRPCVLVGMDFHAHLMHTEIIGFLAGRWIPEKKVLEIHDCYPCRSLPIDQEHTNVEMDPTSECEVRQQIVDHQLQVVGWYHSHPTFLPDPSLVDIENQRNYQHLFRDVEWDEEPFVGAIVGPYDTRLPGSASVINWFYVNRTADERGHPKRLRYELSDVKEISEDRINALLRLTEEYQLSPDRVRLQERWRQDRDDSRMDKMFVSLLSRTPREDSNGDSNGNEDGNDGDDPSSTTETKELSMATEDKMSNDDASVSLSSPPIEDSTMAMNTLTLDTPTPTMGEPTDTAMEITTSPIKQQQEQEEEKEQLVDSELVQQEETVVAIASNAIIPPAYQLFYDRARAKLLTWC